MEFSPELIEKAKAAANADELISIAAANGIELTPGQAAEYYGKIKKTGALTDDELDNVSGGACLGCMDSYADSKKTKWKPGDFVSCNTGCAVCQCRNYVIKTADNKADTAVALCYNCSAESVLTHTQYLKRM